MSKLFRKLTLIAVLLALVVVLGRIGVFGNAAQEIVLNISVPVVDVIGYPFRTVRRGWDTIAENRQLLSKNAALQARVDDLERKYNATRDLQARNRQLEELVKLEQEYNYQVIAARIVLKDDLGWSKTIIIDRGRRDGIVPNMAVVSGAGLVGKVIESGYAYAKVLLIIDRSFKVGARLRLSRNTGILEGRGANQLMLNYLPHDAGVVPGDEVVTSGLGGLFPSGYLIGTVTKTVFEEYGFYQYASVDPSVDFNTLEYVAVVKRMPPEIDLSGIEQE
jgi:rod shape-determining protein MreC